MIKKVDKVQRCGLLVYAGQAKTKVVRENLLNLS